MAPRDEIVIIRPSFKAYSEWLAASLILVFYDRIIMIICLLAIWYLVGTRRYKIAPDRINIEYGLIMKVSKTIRIDQIKNIYVKQGPLQKPFNVGDVRIITSDPLMPRFDIKGIPDPAALKSLLAKYSRRLKEQAA
jgi:membrane protein YdbS with pleckstrin-like domain